MEPDQLRQSKIATSFFSFISKAKIVVLAGNLAKKVSSILLMLIFTLSAFVVLIVSAILMTVESLGSAILSKAKTTKKESVQDLLKNEPLSPNQVSQTK